MNNNAVAQCNGILLAGGKEKEEIGGRGLPRGLLALGREKKHNSCMSIPDVVYVPGTYDNITVDLLWRAQLLKFWSAGK